MELQESFPIFPTTAPKSTSPTKINIIIPSIPLSDARVINLVLLIAGVSLNFLIIFTIASKYSLRTSSNLYLISLSCSNMVILIEPFEEILKWFFDINMRLNMDYVCIISFDVSVITIAILKFILYVDIFQEQTTFGHVLLKKFTTIKGIILIWSSCIISLAIGLHIYDYFEGDMADIYVWNTIMFIALPIIISIALNSLTIYELMILKLKEGSWRTKELRHYFLLVTVAVAFFLIRTPYRLARAISFIAPKASCCTDKKMEVLYFMAKTYPTVFSLIYIAFSREFREAIQEGLTCKCKTPMKETHGLAIPQQHRDEDCRHYMCVEKDTIIRLQKTVPAKVNAAYVSLEKKKTSKKQEISGAESHPTRRNFRYGLSVNLTPFNDPRCIDTNSFV